MKFTKPFVCPLVLLLVACGSPSSGDDTDAGDTTTEVVDTIAEVEDSTAEVPVDLPVEDVVEETGCTSATDCDDSDPCTVDSCDDSTGDCDHVPVDADGDGYPATSVDSTDCGGTDCDDSRDDIHPDVVPTCTDEDLDCSGGMDRDEDGDGYDREGCSGDDCADDDATAFPGSGAVDCTDLDHDCNGYEDHDNDGDLHDREACGGDDCDDADPARYPGNADTACDWVDNDCDDVVAVMDDDSDGYGDATECGGDDCNDDLADVNPGTLENTLELCTDFVIIGYVTRDIDNDCDGDPNCWDSDCAGFHDCLNPTGEFDLTPPISTACFYTWTVDSLEFTDDLSTLSVYPSPCSCAMTGGSAWDSRSIDVTCTTSVDVCTMTCSLTGTFDTPNHWAGTLSVTFGSTCGSCSNVDHDMEGNRERPLW